MRKILAICMALVLVGCGVDDPEGVGVDPVKVGDSVPAFSVTLQDGNEFNSRNHASWPAVIVFFHTSCADCQKTLPVVQRVYERYRPNGVNFVCIARAQGSADIQSFWQQNRLSMPWSAQEDRKVYSLFAASRIPRVYIVNKEGKVISIYADNPCPTYEDLSLSLDSILLNWGD